MELVNDRIMLHPDKFLINSLFCGILVQHLSDRTQLSTAEITKRVSEQANNQLDCLSEVERQKMIDMYISVANS